MLTADIDFIQEAAVKIKRQIKSGEIAEACCMTAAPTPVTESWEVAQEWTVNNSLTFEQQHALLSLLKPEVKYQLETSGFDDFDLIYERLLQLVL